MGYSTYTRIHAVVKKEDNSTDMKWSPRYIVRKHANKYAWYAKMY